MVGSVGWHDTALFDLANFLGTAVLVVLLTLGVAVDLVQPLDHAGDEAR
ncbi:hypothetical protein [Sphingomonas sp.]